jgi:hypothetical protein
VTDLQWRVVNADPAARLDMAETPTGCYRVEGAFIRLRASFYPSGVYTPPEEALIGDFANLHAAHQACELHHRQAS